LVSSECGDLDEFIRADVQFDADRADRLFVRLFDIADPFEVVFFDNGSSCDYNINGDFAFEDENFFYEGFVTDIFVDGDEFSVEIMALRFVQGDDTTPPEDFACTLSYGR